MLQRVVASQNNHMALPADRGNSETQHLFVAVVHLQPLSDQPQCYCRHCCSPVVKVRDGENSKKQNVTEVLLGKLQTCTSESCYFSHHFFAISTLIIIQLAMIALGNDNRFPRKVLVPGHLGFLVPRDTGYRKTKKACIGVSCQGLAPEGLQLSCKECHNNMFFARLVRCMTCNCASESKESFSAVTPEQKTAAERKNTVIDSRCLRLMMLFLIFFSKSQCESA